HARQFNPIFDLNEDPITGIAAGALGSYLAHHGLSPKKNFVIEQGYIIGKAGKIYVDLADGVKVGGNAVIVGTKQITLP
ncbi:MAG: phenazine biosynthesis protein phzf family, partial [Patescibacteria group bacterium]|nr:phenazine biosynthesis protein phzf family [Patescibacteria group bacterium]